MSVADLSGLFFLDTTIYGQALLIKAETGYSFYDTLVITAAIESNCKTLISEAMQDGRIIRGLTILNPFV